jgi:hypothetical protein
MRRRIRKVAVVVVVVGHLISVIPPSYNGFFMGYLNSSVCITKHVKITRTDTDKIMK